MLNKNILRIISDIPENIKLVAISKTKSAEDIMMAYETGQRVFGENKIQEMSAKFEDLPKDIKWHMVGHVQSNKIKYMAPYIDLIHGIDSLKSIKILNKEGAKNNRILNCLLQLKISKEESKFGLGEKQFKEIIYSDEYKEMKNVKIKGLMAMASNTNEKSIIRSEFVHAKKIFDEINNGDKSFEILSMGMSNDYKIAIECGSNMIRLGSLIFGERNYWYYLYNYWHRTTGGKFNEEKITEIAIFKLSKNGNITKYHKLINPEKKIQPFVEKLTGLNNKMLENKPVFSEISQEINSFTKGCIFVAHNAKFDYRVLKKEFSRIGMKFQRDLLCTIELSKIVFPEMKSYSLGKLVSNLGIEIKNRHRADGDAEATLNLFVLLTKNIERDKLDKLVSFENE